MNEHTQIMDKLSNMESHMLALTKFLVDVPDGTEVADAARDVAFCWTKLAELRATVELEPYTYRTIGGVIDKLHSATRRLEKLNEFKSNYSSRR